MALESGMKKSDSIKSSGKEVLSKSELCIMVANSFETLKSNKLFSSAPKTFEMRILNAELNIWAIINNISQSNVDAESLKAICDSIDWSVNDLKLRFEGNEHELRNELVFKIVEDARKKIKGFIPQAPEKVEKGEEIDPDSQNEEIEGNKESVDSIETNKQKELTYDELVNFVYEWEQRISGLNINTKSTSPKLQKEYDKATTIIYEKLEVLEKITLTESNLKPLCDSITEQYKRLERSFKSDASALGRVNNIKTKVNEARGLFNESFAFPKALKIKEDISDKKSIETVARNNTSFVKAMSRAGVERSKIPDRLSEVCHSMALEMAEYFYKPLGTDRSLNPGNCFSKDDVVIATRIFDDFAQFAKREAKRISGNKKLTHSDFCDEFSRSLSKYKFRKVGGKKTNIYTGYFRKGVIQYITSFIKDISNPKDFLDLYSPIKSIDFEYAQACILQEKFDLFLEGETEVIDFTKNEITFIINKYKKFNGNSDYKDLNQKIHHLCGELNSVYHGGISFRNVQNILDVLKDEGLMEKGVTLESLIPKKESGPEADIIGDVEEDAIDDNEGGNIEVLSELGGSEDQLEKISEEGVICDGQQVVEQIEDVNPSNGNVEEEDIDAPEEDGVSMKKDEASEPAITPTIFGDPHNTDVEERSLEENGTDTKLRQGSESNKGDIGEAKDFDLESIGDIISSELSSGAEGFSSSEATRLSANYLRLFINITRLAIKNHEVLNLNTQEIKDRIEGLRQSLENKVLEIQSIAHRLEELRSQIIFVTKFGKEIDEEGKRALEEYIRAKDSLDSLLEFVDIDEKKNQIKEIERFLDSLGDNAIKAREFLNSKGDLGIVLDGMELQDLVSEDLANIINQDNETPFGVKIFELKEALEEVLDHIKDIKELKSEHNNLGSIFSVAYREAKKYLDVLNLTGNFEVQVGTGEVLNNNIVPTETRESLDPLEKIKVNIDGREVQIRRISADALQILSAIQRVNNSNNESGQHYSRGSNRLLGLLKMIRPSYEKYYNNEIAKIIEDDLVLISDDCSGKSKTKIAHKLFESSQFPLIQFSIGPVASANFPSCESKFAITLKGMRLARSIYSTAGVDSREQGVIGKEIKDRRAENALKRQLRAQNNSK